LAHEQGGQSRIGNRAKSDHTAIKANACRLDPRLWNLKKRAPLNENPAGCLGRGMGTISACPAPVARSSAAIPVRRVFSIRNKPNTG
jgi:hypothetical protein